VSKFWDRIKPSTPAPKVVDLQVAKDLRSVRLVWDDGRQATLAARALRQECPCAACVDEWTNQRTLDVDRVAEEITLTQVAPVGNYALTFTFSDQHSTGIYPFELLRRLGTA
jgi:DUF971 family protein